MHLGLRVFEAADTVALDMLDKDRTYVIARARSASTPRTRSLSAAPPLAFAVAGELSYPCALKLVHSHRFQRRSGTGVKAFVVHDSAELCERFAYTRSWASRCCSRRSSPGPTAASSATTRTSTSRAVSASS